MNQGKHETPCTVSRAAFTGKHTLVATKSQRGQAIHQHINGMVSVRAPIEAQMILHQFGEKATDQANVERPVKVIELDQM